MFLRMLKWKLIRVFLKLLRLKKRSLGNKLITLGPLLDMLRCTEAGHQLLGTTKGVGIMLNLDNLVVT